MYQQENIVCWRIPVSVKKSKPDIFDNGFADGNTNSVYYKNMILEAINVDEKNFDIKLVLDKNAHNMK